MIWCFKESRYFCYQKFSPQYAQIKSEKEAQSHIHVQYMYPVLATIGSHKWELPRSQLDSTTLIWINNVHVTQINTAEVPISTVIEKGIFNLCTFGGIRSCEIQNIFLEWT